MFREHHAYQADEDVDDEAYDCDEEDEKIMRVMMRIDEDDTIDQDIRSSSVIITLSASIMEGKLFNICEPLLTFRRIPVLS